MADVTATSITVGLWNALKSPDQYDYAGGVAGVLDPLVESFAAVVLQAANAATGDASSKLKLADELARQARAWESVTSDIASSIDPANVVLAKCVNYTARRWSYSYPFRGASDEPGQADQIDR